MPQKRRKRKQNSGGPCFLILVSKTFYTDHRKTVLRIRTNVLPVDLPEKLIMQIALCRDNKVEVQLYIALCSRYMPLEML